MTVWRPKDNKYPIQGREEDIVFQDSSFIPKDARPCRGEDLTVPIDSSVLPDLSVVLVNWALEPHTPMGLDLPVTDTRAPTFMAVLTFSDGGGPGAVKFTLKHDVSFVTSYPCTGPSMARSCAPPQKHTSSTEKIVSRFWSRRTGHRVELFDRLQPPLFVHRFHAPQPDLPAETDNQSPESAPLDFKPLREHPLHVWYNYKIVPATAVFNPNFTDNLLKSPDRYANPDYCRRDHKTTLVLDARGSKDLELLARAWCAAEGCDAVIGRTTRTCLACCIREASGLGIGVVIRV
ncbi:uncharacterized protein EI97DRAFT_432440 [Westerdykella ornata]|uniref:Uncharacterized protein n=1 Tax=Westerdykella ornata TaxID=318751 RepID=A0A6A6JLP1_WESOR|nr:uncharacterized protein EI97DRAFT_432440 [Westerdykella ornata]KAF2277580.1 hypothetical protein EI97DRAFT_432440 [Westerdykella ornata]